jgi:hypothetical protein
MNTTGQNKMKQRVSTLRRMTYLGCKEVRESLVVEHDAKDPELIDCRDDA